MAGVDFLIGSVPGCDLRLPGTALPPVVCLIARQSDGVMLRKLAPAQAVLVNGTPVTVQRLANGDRVSIGDIELIAHVEQVPTASTPTAPGNSTIAIDTFAKPQAANPDWKAELDSKQRQLDEQTRELETDRVLWYRRREEVDQECRRQTDAAMLLGKQLEVRQQELNAAREALEQREREFDEQRNQLGQQQQDLESRAEKLAKQTEELNGARRELDAIRQQIYERYRQRRDRLAGLQEAVARAARKVQEHKRSVEGEAEHFATKLRELQLREADLAAQLAQLARDRDVLENDRRLNAQQKQEHERALAERLAELQGRERQLAEERQALEKGQAQYQGDLVRLDRLAAQLDERQKQTQEREQDLQRRSEELQRDLRELEDQAVQLDEAHVQLAADAERIARQNADLDKRTAEVAQRAAAVEGQQTMLMQLRTRLERMREDLRREAQLLTEQRARQEAAEVELQQRLQEAQRLRAELDADRHAHEEQTRIFQERSTELEGAVARLRETQNQVAAQEAELSQRQGECTTRTAEQAEQAAVLQARAAQLADLQQRLAADRQALRDREAALARAEEAREALQEQLRRRSDELNARQRGLAEQIQQHEEASVGFQGRVVELQARRAELEREHEVAQQQLAQRLQEMAARHQELEGWEQRVRQAHQQVEQAGQALAGERQALGDERERTVADRQALSAEAEHARAGLASAHEEILQLHRQFPEMEQRAMEAIGRLGQVRERLREHMAELHGYARQGHEGLEALRAHLQAQAEEVRRHSLALHQAREEHRLAVASFRQQLIDWQGQIGDMKRVLAAGETRLERRHAEVEEQARVVDADAARLAHEAQQLGEQQRQVSERRGEVERHLSDMREWYRRKMRELSGESEHSTAHAHPEPVGTMPPERNILSMTGEVSPGDRKLGNLLRSLELIEPEILTALLVEARRQRRSLRQVLLSGGYLTLYQLALIEAGNVDALVLGPTRVIDRVRATSREAVYRVFDPRRGREVLLRVLSESEALDAVHPDEFRQRFAAAAVVEHPHLAATLEVLEVADRPAVLQEWVTGLPSSDWPVLAAVPGVWYRLLSQAALGLQTIHQAGQVHGHLTPESILLTGEGVVKLVGLGEPVWLVERTGPYSVDEMAMTNPKMATEDAGGDLAALGRVVAGWITLGQRGPKKTKPLANEMQAIIDRLSAAVPEQRYASAAALLEDLDRAGGAFPPNPEAWDRLLRHVREALTPQTQLRMSA
jgi:chromosome segregation ATPase